MEQVIVAVGSNLGNRHEMLQQAGFFLDEISDTPVQNPLCGNQSPSARLNFRF